MVEDRDGTISIWVVGHHLPWFPAVLAKLDANGKPIGEYWHPGHIGRIAEGTLMGQRVVLLGATNNEDLTASLVAVDYDNPTGYSRATNKSYLCENCPEGNPISHIVFPRSEIARILDTRQQVREIRTRSNGNIEITVGADAKVSGNSPGQSYVFDNQLQLVSAEVVESYVYAHNEMQIRGIINHTLNRTRESNLIRPSRYWDGSRFSNQRPMTDSAF